MAKIVGNYTKSKSGLTEIPKGIIEVKNVSSPSMITDTDGKTVTGYASIFGNKDLDVDIILPGAFAKSINENGPQGKNTILFLWQHNPGKVLAKPSILKEDSKGLYYEATITSGATFAEDALKLIAGGLVEENSIGFQTVKSVIQQPDAQDWETWYRELIELNLYEHSAVTWGANPQAQMTGVKSAMSREDLNAREAKLLKALRIDGMRDETYAALELSIKQINTEYYNLGKGVSLEEKGAAMITCPNCKSAIDTEQDGDENALTGEDMECPNCKCMFTKSTLLITSRKSLMSGVAGIPTKSVYSFNF